LEFATVRAEKKEFIAGKANRDGISGLPLASSIAIGRVKFVLPGVDHSLDVDNDRAASRASARFANNLGFGPVSVLRVVALDATAAAIEFGGAAADGREHLGRIVSRHLRHTEFLGTRIR
jgi:hypothetical protein